MVELCPRCKKNVTRAQGGIQCRDCLKWLHFGCAGLAYNKEAADKLRGQWQCYSCKSSSNDQYKATPPPKAQNTRGTPREESTKSQGPSVSQPTEPKEIPLGTSFPDNNTECSYCHKDVDIATSFLCFFCNEWEHASCRGINADLVLVMKREDNECLLFKYECLSCSKRKVALLQLQVRQLTEAQPHRPHEATPSNHSEKPSPHDIQPTINAIIQVEVEKELREQKKMNFVVMGLPESTAVNDTTQVVKLTQENELGANITEGEILETARIGRPKEDGSPRTLLVKLKKSQELEMKRQTILRTAPNLRKSSNEETRTKVYINPDLTPMQRQMLAVKRQQKRNTRTQCDRQMEMQSHWRRGKDSNEEQWQI